MSCLRKGYELLRLLALSSGLTNCDSFDGGFWIWYPYSEATLHVASGDRAVSKALSLWKGLNEKRGELHVVRIH